METAFQRCRYCAEARARETGKGILCARIGYAVQPGGGCVWSVEVKNCRNIMVDKLSGQARRNAGKKRWMLMCKIHQTASWLVLRKGMRPSIWHEK